MNECKSNANQCKKSREKKMWINKKWKSRMKISDGWRTEGVLVRLVQEEVSKHALEFCRFQLPTVTANSRRCCCEFSSKQNVQLKQNFNKLLLLASSDWSWFCSQQHSIVDTFSWDLTKSWFLKQYLQQQQCFKVHVNPILFLLYLLYRSQYLYHHLKSLILFLFSVFTKI